MFVYAIGLLFPRGFSRVRVRATSYPSLAAVGREVPVDAAAVRATGTWYGCRRGKEEPRKAKKAHRVVFGWGSVTVVTSKTLSKAVATAAVTTLSLELLRDTLSSCSRWDSGGTSRISRGPADTQKARYHNKHRRKRKQTSATGGEKRFGSVPVHVGSGALSHVMQSKAKL